MDIANPLVLAVIDQFRALHDRAKEQYTNGDCYRFYLLLRRIFPDAQPWYDTLYGHVLTQIGTCLYDITGLVWSVRAAPPYVDRWSEVDPVRVSGAPSWKWRS